MKDGATFFRRALVHFLRFLGIAIVAVFLISLLWMGYYSFFKVGGTIQMGAYHFKSAEDAAKLKVEYEWVPLDSISRNMIIAVLAAEDKNFFIHNGFALLPEGDSLKTLIPKEDETISQKAVHAVFLTKGESKIKSYIESYFTILSEYMWGKERILEIYLNTAPLGHGVFGVEAASQIYFGKQSGNLTREEAASIALLFVEPQDKQMDFMYPPADFCEKQSAILINMAMMTQIKLGKTPVDETVVEPTKPIYKRNWRG
ncbi:monofunctional biosynthetic peptidoglycan transglycosylase [Dysgonomonas sp. PH5-45]|uniref:transglycosylase domain-containing protein n=1 Tax=unclassified Dysgonomonas TaxID=2630389 RepID=UPI0024750E9A|nr:MULTISPECIES: transglycosylase domain-containing protein [unclassified Dysgonomonas]MDH6353892.1 monofunctional biosynthetic peptidoglycan transglycosylase [Dysgonomonas sp. PH5-45]MDH6386794.1 monofunctional biosynthetic peptidoglycan transglycosylase [Dysgonomonas sp. PH5-37]